jgi:hypothetical protein
VIRILGQHAEEIKCEPDAKSSAVPDTCEHLDAAADAAEPDPRTPGHCEACKEDGIHAWAMLRFQPAPARRRTLQADRSSGDEIRRAG